MLCVFVLILAKPRHVLTQKTEFILSGPKSKPASTRWKGEKFSLLTQYISENYIGRSLLMNPTGSPKLLGGFQLKFGQSSLNGFQVNLRVCQYFCFAFFTEMKVCDDLCKVYIWGTLYGACGLWGIIINILIILWQPSQCYKMGLFSVQLMYPRTES